MDRTSLSVTVPQDIAGSRSGRLEPEPDTQRGIREGGAMMDAMSIASDGVPIDLDTQTQDSGHGRDLYSVWGAAGALQGPTNSHDPVQLAVPRKRSLPAKAKPSATVTPQAEFLSGIVRQKSRIFDFAPY